MSNKHPKGYKPDSSVSDETTKDLISDLKDFDNFCRETLSCKPFWSPADRVVFTDIWTTYMQRLLSHGRSLHGFNHRIVLDDDDYEEHREVVNRYGCLIPEAAK